MLSNEQLNTRHRTCLFNFKNSRLTFEIEFTLFNLNFAVCVCVFFFFLVLSLYFLVIYWCRPFSVGAHQVVRNLLPKHSSRCTPIEKIYRLNALVFGFKARSNLRPSDFNSNINKNHKIFYLPRKCELIVF